MLAVLLTIGAAGVVTANPASVEQGDYHLDYSMNRTEAGLIDIRTRVVDATTGAVMG